jgi:hypothetical protein
VSVNSYKFPEQLQFQQCLTAIPSIFKGSRQQQVKFDVTMLSISHSLQQANSKHDFHRVAARPHLRGRMCPFEIMFTFGKIALLGSIIHYVIYVAVREPCLVSRRATR